MFEETAISLDPGGGDSALADELSVSGTPLADADVWGSGTPLASPNEADGTAQVAGFAGALDS